jgi:hypothetical protein
MSGLPTTPESDFSAARYANLHFNQWLRLDGEVVPIPTDPRQRERMLDQERRVDELLTQEAS